MGIYALIMPPGGAADTMNSILSSFLSFGANAPGGSVLPDIPDEWGDFPGESPNLDTLQQYDEMY
jgi:hypothetical protein